MFNSKGMTHLGFALEKKNKGNGNGDGNYGESTPFPLAPCIQPRCATPHKAAPPWIARRGHGDGGKQKEERRGNPTRFWGERRWRTAACPNLPSLLFLSLSLHVLLMHGNRGWRHREGPSLGFGGVLFTGVLSCAYCSMVHPANKLKKL